MSCRFRDPPLSATSLGPAHRPPRAAGWSIRPDGWSAARPEMIESVEGELLLVLEKVVLDINDETFVLPAVLRPSQTSPDHLLIQVPAESRAGDKDGADGRRIKTLGQYVE